MITLSASLTVFGETSGERPGEHVLTQAIHATQFHRSVELKSTCDDHKYTSFYLSKSWTFCNKYIANAMNIPSDTF